MFKKNIEEKIIYILENINVYVNEIKSELGKYINTNKIIHTFHLNSNCYIERLFTDINTDNYKKNPRITFPQLRKDMHKIEFMTQSLQNLLKKSFEEFQKEINISISNEKYESLQQNIQTNINKISNEKNMFFDEIKNYELNIDVILKNSS